MFLFLPLLLLLRFSLSDSELILSCFFPITIFVTIQSELIATMWKTSHIPAIPWKVWNQQATINKEAFKNYEEYPETA